MNDIGRSTIVLAFMMAISVNALAVNQIGAISCGKWVEDHADRKSWRTIVEDEWLAGFLSGEAVSLDVDILANTDLTSLALWVTNYCKSNPLSDSFEAVLALANEIARKRGLCARGATCSK
ncbi:hypothetical protein [Burkholderia sp. Nafp2/4-1b]|uniref:hypothetical protein n=1 Tax=Burkholderia sp. Nafp2/4-1b TaxID=2116686 RepID=UPI0013CEE56E|nr:hypothetical protein [Burkholderia sp. Nafp2/4-1b]